MNATIIGSKEVYFYKFKVNKKTFILESRQLSRAMLIQEKLEFLRRDTRVL